MALSFQDAVDAFEKAAAEALVVLSDAITAQAQSAIAPIQQEWPVATGRSRAGWEAVRAINGASVVNGVDYTDDVHGGLADELVPRVLLQSTPGTVAEVEARLTAILEGSG
jgi:hypothetical protein